ncbi:hypothetical protein HMPREF1033_03173, partial [Tannerella sp. 6_1_58FAA_CT1]
MAKIQNISEIHPTLGFTEFDVLEKYRKSFNESELGRLHSVFPFDRMAKSRRPVGTATGTQEYLQPCGEDCPHGPEGVYRILRQTAGEHLNGNIHYQIF